MLDCAITDRLVEEVKFMLNYEKLNSGSTCLKLFEIVDILLILNHDVRIVKNSILGTLYLRPFLESKTGLFNRST